MNSTVLLLLMTGCAVADVPRSEDTSVKVAALDPLILEAREVVTAQRIQQSVEKLIERKQIVASALPDPTGHPEGELLLQIDRPVVALGDKVFTKVNWSLDVADSATNQFSYHVLVVRYHKGRMRSSRQTWGITTALLSGQEHAVMSDSVAEPLGEHRLLAILAVRSIKSERVHIVDVSEAFYSVRTE